MDYTDYRTVRFTDQKPKTTRVTEYRTWEVSWETHTDWIARIEGPWAKRVGRLIRRLGGFQWQYESHCRLVVIDEWDDLSQKNPDIPDIQAFTDMGLQDRQNELLDRQPMNDRDFRERCYVANGRLYALYMRGAPDVKGPAHLRIENIAKWLECDYLLAGRFVEVFRKLGFDRRRVNQVIFGYTMADGTRKSGLKTSTDLENAIRYLEELADDLPEIPRDDVEIALETARQIRYEESLEMEFESVSEQMAYIEQDQEETPTDAVFSGFPLYSEADGCSWEFLTAIRTADLATLNKIQGMLYKQPDPYTGRMRKAKLRFLTPAQRSQVWQYINDRKAKIAEEARGNLSEESRAVLTLIQSIGRCRQSSALIMAYQKGESFDMAGETIVFDQVPPAEDVYALWAEYRKLA